LNLDEILERVAEGLVAVDKSTTHVGINKRTGTPYDPGVKTMREPVFVSELSEWWKSTYPGDFDSVGEPCNCSKNIGVNPELEHTYSHTSRAKCDLRFSSDGSENSNPEWAIEFKHLALVGNNGKNNDYGVSKMLSPYLKDRSLMHDIERMRNDPQGTKQAVIGYCFEYSFDSLDFAEKIHTSKIDVISNLRGVCASVERIKGVYSPVPLIEFADQIYTDLGMVTPVIKKYFQNAWRHPAGGNGYVFGWQII
jgi:hypothetical protein